MCSSRGKIVWEQVRCYRFQLNKRGRWPEKKNTDSVSTIIMRFSQGEREGGGTVEYRASRGKDG